MIWSMTEWNSLYNNVVHFQYILYILDVVPIITCLFLSLSLIHTDCRIDWIRLNICAHSKGMVSSKHYKVLRCSCCLLPPATCHCHCRSRPTIHLLQLHDHMIPMFSNLLLLFFATNVTLGDVINPKKIIGKLSLSPKLSPSDNSIIEKKCKQTGNMCGKSSKKVYIYRQSPIFSPYTLEGSLRRYPLAVKLLKNRLYIYTNPCMDRLARQLKPQSDPT